MSEENREMGWDDEITKESEFELVPAGTYDFRIDAMERGRYTPSETSTMSACNMATLHVVVKNPETGNDVTILDPLYLNTKAEWRLSEFFRSIGQKKHGEPLRPNWNAVPGSTGKCEIEVNTYKSKKTGNDVTNNKIKKYLDYEPKKWTPGGF